MAEDNSWVMTTSAIGSKLYDANIMAAAHIQKDQCQPSISDGEVVFSSWNGEGPKLWKLDFDGNYRGVATSVAKGEILFPSHGSWNLEKGETSEGAIRIINLRFDHPVNGYRSIQLIIDTTDKADNKISKALLLSLKEAEKEHNIQRGAVLPSPAKEETIDGSEGDKTTDETADRTNDSSGADGSGGDTKMETVLEEPTTLTWGLVVNFVWKEIAPYLNFLFVLLVWILGSVCNYSVDALKTLWSRKKDIKLHFVDAWNNLWSAQSGR